MLPEAQYAYLMRGRPSWSVAIIVGGALLIFGAYAVFLVPPPTKDLRLEGVTFVAREAIRMQGYFPLQERPQRGFVRVTLSTKRDLGALADRYDLNLWHEAGPCPSTDLDELDSDGPFWRELALPLQSTRAEEAAYRSAARPEADGRYRYDIYLAPARIGPSNLSYGGRPPAGPYDLTRDRKDVCLVIGGGNMAGGLFRSNVVVVPYGALRLALTNGGA